MNYIKKNIILQHVLIWLTIYLAYSFILSFQGTLTKYLILNMVQVGLFMLAYYILRNIQIPLLYNKNKKLLFVLSLLASSVIYYLIFVAAWKNGVGDFLGYVADKYPVSFGDYLVKTVRFYSPAIAFLAWDSHREGIKEQNRIHELEKEKMVNELKFLKAQINPHFLFNTLNNLYSYVVTESPKAPDMILRLSGILDYVFYKSQKNNLPLSEELATIENFINLEKVRYGDRLEVEFETHGDLSKPISPLVLLSIVENAFKHGASGDIDQARIKITIEANGQQLKCKVWNTKSKYKGEKNDDYKKGIGLKNIKRQLDILYPDKHQLLIDDDEDSFSVLLILNLTV